MISNFDEFKSRTVTVNGKLYEVWERSNGEVILKGETVAVER